MSASNTKLPDDFEQTLQSVFELGIPHEPANTIDTRLAEALRHAAVQSGQKPMDAGWSDWVKSVAENCKQAAHSELCASDGSGLKERYSSLLEKGMTSDGIATISAAVASVINPGFVISSVLIYLSVWLIKFGLDKWCKIPAKQAATVNP
jgi:hypothetical protein